MEKLIKAMGLDPDAPYSLGNKMHYYKRECNSGHTDLKDDEVSYASGWYDGYRYVVPICLRCVPDKRTLFHINNESVHLKPAELADTTEKV